MYTLFCIAMKGIQQYALSFFVVVVVDGIDTAVCSVIYCDEMNSVRSFLVVMK